VDTVEFVLGEKEALVANQRKLTNSSTELLIGQEPYQADCQYAVYTVSGAAVAVVSASLGYFFSVHFGDEFRKALAYLEISTYAYVPE
jgi:hypothetical protein